MVAELQRMLDDLGYNTGPPDGALGPQTERALDNFERDHGLPPSEVSPASIAAVRSVWYEQNRGGSPPSGGGDSVLGGGSPAIVQPSFDCARATAPSAREICANPRLAQLDAEMAAAYVAAKAGSPARRQAKVAAEQHEWLRQRNACGADASCLERTLLERLGQLQASAPTAGTTGIGATPALQETPAASAEQIGDAAAAIERLAQPQEGFRALKFPMLDGLPVFIPDRNTAGDEASFFKLVALGAKPNLIENYANVVHPAGQALGVLPVEGDPNADNARQFAYEFLTRPNKYLGQSAAWAGGNEFQRAASRKAFLRDYAEKLRQMAPRPPFEFVYATELTLGRYDPKLGGFPLRGAPNLRDLPFGSLQPSPDFQWPELLLPIDEAGAQRLLDRLQAETTRHDNPRSVRLAAVIEAGRLDPSSPELQLSLRRLTLYNYDLTRNLYEFPTPSASPRPTADILSQLLAPPPGVMPIRLPTIEGRPILRSDQVSENFLDLVAVGQFPDLLSDQQDPHLLASREIPLVQHLLTPDAQRQVLENPVFSGLPGNQFLWATGNTGWKGEDEFAQRQSQQSFERIYLPKLKDFAPKGPFEFALVNYAQLPEYDFKRGGIRPGES